jgi:hypothetical protein
MLDIYCKNGVGRRDGETPSRNLEPFGVG